MKTTLGELSKLFKLTIKDHRRLRLGLANKIKVLQQGKVVVDDRHLEELLARFRNCGSYDLREIREKYHISENALLQLVKEKRISSFQFTTARGSKLLFFKDDIEKEEEVILHYIKKLDRRKFARMAERIFMESHKSNFLSEREYNLFRSYYFMDQSLEQVAGEYDVSQERARQIIEKTNRRVQMRFQRALRAEAESDSWQDKYFELSKRHRKLESILNTPELLIEYAEKHRILLPLNVMDMSVPGLTFSVRTKNRLRSKGIETVGQLINKSSKELMRIKGFGEMSLREVEDELHRLGLEWPGKDDSHQFLSH